MALLLAACAAVLGSSIALGILAVAGICLFALGVDRLEAHSRSDRQTRRGSDQALGAWLTAAWFLGLLLATPLYHPYPRLTLPWLAAAWLGGAAAVGWTVRCLGPALNQILTGTGLDRSEGFKDSSAEANGAGGAKRQEASRPAKPAERSAQIEADSASVAEKIEHQKPLPIHLRWLPGLCCLLAAVVLIGSAERLTSKGVPGWQPRTSLMSVAGQLLEDARRAAAETATSRSVSVGYILYVYAEPGLFFHLSHLADDGVAHPAGNLGFGRPDGSAPDIPTFLVAGPHAWRSRDFAEQWSRVSDRFEEVARYAYEPSDLVLFDEPEPPTAGADGERPTEAIRLYLLK